MFYIGYETLKLLIFIYCYIIFRSKEYPDLSTKTRAFIRLENKVEQYEKPEKLLLKHFARSFHQEYFLRATDFLSLALSLLKKAVFFVLLDL